MTDNYDHSDCAVVRLELPMALQVAGDVIGVIGRRWPKAHITGGNSEIHIPKNPDTGGYGDPPEDYDPDEPFNLADDKQSGMHLKPEHADALVAAVRRIHDDWHPGPMQFCRAVICEAARALEEPTPPKGASP